MRYSMEWRLAGAIPFLLIIFFFFYFLCNCHNLKVDIAKSPEAGTYSLLNLLPTVHCLSPDEVLKLRNRNAEPSREFVFTVI